MVRVLILATESHQIACYISICWLACCLVSMDGYLVIINALDDLYGIG